MTSKKKYSPKTEVKKAYKHLFDRALEVKNVEKQLKDLKLKEKKLYKEFDEKEEKFNNSSSKITDDFLERLPLFDLHRFQLFEAGKKIDYPTKFIKDRKSNEKDLYKRGEELMEIDSKIDMLKIDLLLEKINYLTKEL